jgi:hypothetical protein
MTERRETLLSLAVRLPCVYAWTAFCGIILSVSILHPLWDYSLLALPAERIHASVDSDMRAHDSIIIVLQTT